MSNPNSLNTDPQTTTSTEWDTLSSVAFENGPHAGTGTYKQERAELLHKAHAAQGLAEAPGLSAEAEAARDAAAMIAHRQAQYLDNVEAGQRAEAAALRDQKLESTRLSEVPVNEETAVNAFFSHGTEATSKLRQAQALAEKYATPHSQKERHELIAAQGQIEALTPQVEDFNRRKTNRQDIIAEARRKMQTYDQAKQAYNHLGAFQKMSLRLQGKTLPKRDDALADYNFRADSLLNLYSGMTK